MILLELIVDTSPSDLAAITGDVTEILKLDKKICSKIRSFVLSSTGVVPGTQHFDVGRFLRADLTCITELAIQNFIGSPIRLNDAWTMLSQHLQTLRVVKCVAFREIPDAISNLTSLIHLQITRCCDFEHINSEISKLKTLAHLEVDDCKNFEYRLSLLQQPPGQALIFQLESLLPLKSLQVLILDHNHPASDASGLYARLNSFENLHCLSLRGCTRVGVTPDQEGDEVPIGKANIFELRVSAIPEMKQNEIRFLKDYFPKLGKLTLYATPETEPSLHDLLKTHEGPPIPGPEVFPGLELYLECFGKKDDPDINISERLIKQHPAYDFRKVSMLECYIDINTRTVLPTFVNPTQPNVDDFILPSINNETIPPFKKVGEFALEDCIVRHMGMLRLPNDAISLARYPPTYGTFFDSNMFGNLQTLKLVGLEEITDLPCDLETLTSLQYLVLERLPLVKGTAFSYLARLTTLTALSLVDLPSLDDVRHVNSALEQLTQLLSLTLAGCNLDQQPRFNLSISIRILSYKWTKTDAWWPQLSSPNLQQLLIDSDIHDDGWRGLAFGLRSCCRQLPNPFAAFRCITLGLQSSLLGANF
jgi:hypothetical protein